MDLFTWNESHSVRIEALDAQHKKLILLVNELYQGQEKGLSRAELFRIVAGLLDYAMHHFKAEEDLMAEYGFPGLEAHKKEHDEFRLRITKFAEQFVESQNDFITPLSYYLLGWLLTHVFLVDKQYSAFLNARGVH